MVILGDSFAGALMNHDASFASSSSSQSSSSQAGWSPPPARQAGRDVKHAGPTQAASQVWGGRRVSIPMEDDAPSRRPDVDDILMAAVPLDQRETKVEPLDLRLLRGVPQALGRVADQFGHAGAVTRLRQRLGEFDVDALRQKDLPAVIRRIHDSADITPQEAGALVGALGSMCHLAGWTTAGRDAFIDAIVRASLNSPRSQRPERAMAMFAGLSEGMGEGEHGCTPAFLAVVATRIAAPALPRPEAERYYAEMRNVQLLDAVAFELCPFSAGFPDGAGRTLALQAMLCNPQHVGLQAAGRLRLAMGIEAVMTQPRSVRSTGLAGQTLPDADPPPGGWLLPAHVAAFHAPCLLPSMQPACVVLAASMACLREALASEPLADEQAACEALRWRILREAPGWTPQTISAAVCGHALQDCADGLDSRSRLDLLAAWMRRVPPEHPGAQALRAAIAQGIAMAECPVGWLLACSESRHAVDPVQHLDLFHAVLAARGPEMPKGELLVELSLLKDAEDPRPWVVSAIGLLLHYGPPKVSASVLERVSRALIWRLDFGATERSDAADDLESLRESGDTRDQQEIALLEAKYDTIDRELNQMAQVQVPIILTGISSRLHEQWLLHRGAWDADDRQEFTATVRRTQTLLVREAQTWKNAQSRFLHDLIAPGRVALAAAIDALAGLQKALVDWTPDDLTDRKSAPRRLPVPVPLPKAEAKAGAGSGEPPAPLVAHPKFDDALIGLKTYRLLLEDDPAKASRERQATFELLQRLGALTLDAAELLRQAPRLLQQVCEAGPSHHTALAIGVLGRLCGGGAMAEASYDELLVAVLRGKPDAAGHRDPVDDMRHASALFDCLTQVEPGTAECIRHFAALGRVLSRAVPHEEALALTFEVGRQIMGKLNVVNYPYFLDTLLALPPPLASSLASAPASSGQEARVFRAACFGMFASGLAMAPGGLGAAGKAALLDTLLQHRLTHHDTALMLQAWLDKQAAHDVPVRAQDAAALIEQVVQRPASLGQMGRVVWGIMKAHHRAAKRDGGALAVAAGEALLVRVLEHLPWVEMGSADRIGRLVAVLVQAARQGSGGPQRLQALSRWIFNGVESLGAHLAVAIAEAQEDDPMAGDEALARALQAGQELPEGPERLQRNATRKLLAAGVGYVMGLSEGVGQALPADALRLQLTLPMPAAAPPELQEALWRGAQSMRDRLAQPAAPGTGLDDLWREVLEGLTREPAPGVETKASTPNADPHAVTGAKSARREGAGAPARPQPVQDETPAKRKSRLASARQLDGPPR